LTVPGWNQVDCATAPPFPLPMSAGLCSYRLCVYWVCIYRGLYLPGSCLPGYRSEVGECHPTSPSGRRQRRTPRR
jgi:hypothetical protein